MDLTGYNCEITRAEITAFERNRYTIGPEQYQALLNFAGSCLRARSEQPGTRMILRVAGYTDRTGAPASDRGMSFSRALEVARFLTAYLRSKGLALRAAVEGRGLWNAPEQNGDAGSEEGQPLGRRVEVSLCIQG
jgi:outer membrane protein OmpA-like peptidoglycan-associated protein